MPRLVRMSLVLFLIIGLARPLAAQDELPHVTVIQSSGNGYLKDLQYIVELVGPNGKTQWKNNLYPFFEFFTPGVDLTKPIRVDVLMDNETRVRLNIPIESLDTFLDNLVLFGIKSKLLQPNYYQLTLQGGPAAGANPANNANRAFLRLTNGYAVLSYLQADLPRGLPDPAIAIAGQLANKSDVTGEAMNDAEGLEKRRNAYREFSKNLLDAVKLNSTEDSGDFEIRQLMAKQKLEVIERFFVESSRLVAGWTTDVANKQGRFDIDLAALENTSLESAIRLLGQKPSYFANVKRDETAIVSGSINFTLDKLYKDQLLALTALARPNAKKKIDALDNKNDEQKKGSQTATELFFDLFEAGTKSSDVDGFVELYLNQSTQHSLVGGIRVQDAAGKSLDILKLLPAIQSDLKVELAVESEGDIEIHRLTGLLQDNADFKDFFGDDAAVFLGFDQQAVWYSVGVASLPRLKSVIRQVDQNQNPNNSDQHEQIVEGDGGQVGENTEQNGAKRDDQKIVEQISAIKEAAPETPLFDVHIKIGPIIEFLDRQRQRLDKENAAKKLTDKEKAVQKEQDKMRKMAITAFKSGDDTINVHLQREGDLAKVRMIFGEGILRFVGSVMADFAAENL